MLDKRVARLCVLASNCDVDAYKKLVKALCETNNIPIIEVETHALLGEWCGLCKLDKEGNARKVPSLVTCVGWDCVVLQAPLSWLGFVGTPGLSTCLVCWRYASCAASGWQVAVAPAVQGPLHVRGHEPFVQLFNQSCASPWPCLSCSRSPSALLPSSRTSVRPRRRFRSS